MLLVVGQYKQYPIYGVLTGQLWVWLYLSNTRGPFSGMITCFCLWVQTLKPCPITGVATLVAEKYVWLKDQRRVL